MLSSVGFMARRGIPALDKFLASGTNSVGVWGRNPLP